VGDGTWARQYDEATLHSSVTEFRPEGSSVSLTHSLESNPTHRQALAIQLSRNFDEVCIWAREEATVAAINDGHENTQYFPGFRLPESIKATTNKDVAVSGSDDENETILVLIVVPTPALEEVVRDLRLDDRHILVSCTKGILNDTLETPDAILTRVTGGFRRVAFLSGPSFAKEVAENQPTVGVDPRARTP